MASDRNNEQVHKQKYNKFPFKLQKPLCRGESGQALEQVLQRSCGVSIPRHVQNLSGHGPEHPAVGEPALSRGLE